MDKNIKEIEDLAKRLHGNACGGNCNSKTCVCGDYLIAEKVIKWGYGDTKQAVREFAEKLKEKIDKIEQHCLAMHNWQGQSAVCEVEENIDELLAEVTGE